jgi:hypothetical protein
MTFAVRRPFLFVARDVCAAQEPEGAFIHGCLYVRRGQLQDAIIVLQQRHTRQIVCKTSTDGRLGGRGFGARAAGA